MTEQRSLP